MKIFTSSLTFLLLLASCAGDKGTDDVPKAEGVYFRANLDGEWIETENPEAFKEVDQTDPNVTVYRLNIVGPVKTSDNTDDTFGASLFFTTPPQAGAYEYEGVCDQLDCGGINYIDVDPQNVLTQYVSGFQEQTSSAFNITTLEFTSGGRVKGTFSGLLLDFISGNQMEVTDGEFDVIIE